jgi:hypothetical protein
MKRGKLMPFNFKKTLIVMELIFQYMLKTNFVIPLYPTTFRETIIPVPTPSGVTDLPPNIYFDLDNRFNAEQEQRIRDAISETMLVWATHMNEKWNGGTNNGISQMAACTNIYATKNLRPAWYSESPIQNGLTATNIAMDQFTQLIRDNGFRRSPRAKIFAAPLNNNTIVFALTAFTQNFVPLSFIVDPTLIDIATLNFITGSMMHSWLHCAGFFDPNTTSYFNTECSMCVMRGFRPKNPDMPDNLYYQFFD